MIEEEKKEVVVERRVPQGREARRMDMFVRIHHGVGTIIESDWERDSWPEKSIKANRDKQSDDPDKMNGDYLKVKQEVASLSKASQSQHQNARETGDDSMLDNSMRQPGTRKAGSMKNVASHAAEL